MKQKALFTEDFSILHHSKIQRGREPITGRKYTSVRNSLAFMLDYHERELFESARQT